MPHTRREGMCGLFVVPDFTHFADAQSRHQLRGVMRLPSQVPRLRFVAQRHVRTKLVPCRTVKANKNKEYTVTLLYYCCFVHCVSSHRACRIGGTQRREGSKVGTSEPISDLPQMPSYTHAEKKPVTPPSRSKDYSYQSVSFEKTTTSRARKATSEKQNRNKRDTR